MNKRVWIRVLVLLIIAPFIWFAGLKTHDLYRWQMYGIDIDGNLEITPVKKSPMQYLVGCRKYYYRAHGSAILSPAQMPKKYCDFLPHKATLVMDRDNYSRIAPKDAFAANPTFVVMLDSFLLGLVALVGLKTRKKKI